MLSQNNNNYIIGSVGDIAKLRELILSAKKGNAQAFEELYNTLYTPLYRYTFSRCRDVEMTNDICQQTFLNFYKALPSYQPDKSPLAYLFTIAKRLLINQYDKDKRVSFDESLLEGVSDSSDDIEDDTDVALLAEKINDFLPSLTQDEQDVIRLYFYSELEYKEIAEIIEKEVVYIRKIKERALKKLRILTDHLHD